MGAFRTTLEELRDADVLLHLVDATAKDVENNIEAVDKVLSDLDLAHVPRVLAFNKCDQVAREEAERLCRRFEAIGISAFHPDTLPPLIERLDRTLHAIPRPREHHQAEAGEPGALGVGEHVGSA